jgi:hypothetical protein
LGVTTFFCDVLEHLLVQEELGDELLETLGLALQFTAPALGVELFGLVLASPPIVRVLSDTQLSTDIADRQTFGQIPVGLAQHPRDFVGVPSLSHPSLRRLGLPGD